MEANLIWSEVYMMVFFYGVIINIFSAAQMKMDKQLAIERRYRISEMRLLLPILFGGLPGVVTGIYLFHHKTRKKSFQKKVAAYGAIFAAFFAGVLVSVFFICVCGLVTNF